jgi:hypothetical protein
LGVSPSDFFLGDFVPFRGEIISSKSGESNENIRPGSAFIIDFSPFVWITSAVPATLSTFLSTFSSTFVSTFSSTFALSFSRIVSSAPSFVFLFLVGGSSPVTSSELLLLVEIRTSFVG